MNNSYNSHRELTKPYPNMAAKHQNEGADTASEVKKPKHGFRVGPENLPDGPWRRKGLSHCPIFHPGKIFIHVAYSHFIAQLPKSRRS